MPKIDTNQILMAILGSLVGYVFYGFIELSAQVETVKTKQEQHSSELRDIWGKYNNAGQQMMDFMIDDARQKEQLKEQILQVRLEEANRELDRLKKIIEDK